MKGELKKYKSFEELKNSEISNPPSAEDRERIETELKEFLDLLKKNKKK